MRSENNKIIGGEIKSNIGHGQFVYENDNPQFDIDKRYGIAVTDAGFPISYIDINGTIHMINENEKDKWYSGSLKSDQIKFNKLKKDKKEQLVSKYDDYIKENPPLKRKNVVNESLVDRLKMLENTLNKEVKEAVETSNISDEHKKHLTEQINEVNKIEVKRDFASTLGNMLLRRGPPPQNGVTASNDLAKAVIPSILNVASTIKEISDSLTTNFDTTFDFHLVSKDGALYISDCNAVVTTTETALTIPDDCISYNKEELANINGNPTHHIIEKLTNQIFKVVGSNKSLFHYLKLYNNTSSTDVVSSTISNYQGESLKIIYKIYLNKTNNKLCFTINSITIQSNANIAKLYFITNPLYIKNIHLTGDSIDLNFLKDGTEVYESHTKKGGKRKTKRKYRKNKNTNRRRYRKSKRC